MFPYKGIKKILHQKVVFEQGGWGSSTLLYYATPTTFTFLTSALIHNGVLARSHELQTADIARLRRALYVN